MSLDKAILKAAPERDSLDMRRAERSLEAKLFGSERPPLTLGRYVVVERVGSGGCGLVFAAYDPKLDRKVALKLLRMDPSRAASQEDARGLLREARAMASLSHPNIVPVHDVGSYGRADLGSADSTGLDIPAEGVFIVMELVVGDNLHDWLRSSPRSQSRILDAYIAAGRGLSAAHAAGIIHGDVKPSNIVIGDDGQIRVLDFGLAAWASEQGTGEGDTSGGTPGFLAPERSAGAPSTALSDQFSFCVALRSALSDPVAGRDERRVARRITSALERGLSSDPERRFPSMDALLERIAPHPGRRNVGLLAAAAVGLGVTAFVSADASCDEQATTAVSAVWNQASREGGRSAFLATGRPFAETAWTSVEADLARHAEAWTALRVEACEARQKISARTVCLDRWLIRFEKAVGSLQRANVRLVELGSEATSRLSPHDLCGRSDPDVTISESRREGILAVEGSLASAATLRASGRLDEAREEVDTAFALAQELGDSITLARAFRGRADHFDLIGAAAQAEADYRQALYAAERAADRDMALLAMIRLAELRGVDGGQHEDALALLEHVEARGVDEVTQPELAYTLVFTRGVVLEAMGRAPEALTAYEAVLAMLGPDAPAARRAGIHNNIGVAHDRLGDKRQALDHYVRALELRAESLGTSHPYYANALGNVGITRASLGDERQAIADLEASVRTYERALGPDVDSNRHAAWTIANLGYVLVDRGRAPEGLEHAQRAHAIRLRVLPKGHPHLGLSHRGLARALQANDRSPEALNHAERAVALARNHDNALRLVTALTTDADIVTDLGRADEAVRLAEEATAVAQAQLGATHPRTGGARKQWGRALLERGDVDGAAGQLEQALAIFEQAGQRGVGVAQTRFLLAQAVRDTDPQRASALAREAHRALAASPHRADAAAEIASWLVTAGDLHPAR